MLLGCYTPENGRGAGVSVIRTTGEVDPLVAAVSPSFLAWHPCLPVLYAVAETADGAVVAWSMADGDPQDFGRGETGGADPCHLTVDASGEFLVNVNYNGGSIAVHRLDADGRIGERTDLVRHERHGTLARQDGAHPHMVRATADGLIVTDLGGDAIYLYHLEHGRLICDRLIAAPAGSGPRHSLRVGSRWFVTAELSSNILIYDDDWTLLGEVAANRAAGECYVSELVAAGGFLYVANRGPNTISVFDLAGDLPVYVTEVATGGWPRHMALDGDLIHVANERSDEVTTMRIDPASGIPVQVGSIATPSPTCVLLR